MNAAPTRDTLLDRFFCWFLAATMCDFLTFARDFWAVDNRILVVLTSLVAVVYWLAHLDDLHLLWRQRPFRWIGWFIVGWPALSFLWAIGFRVEHLARQIDLYLNVMAAGLYVYRTGWQGLRRLFRIGLLASAAGIVLSMGYYEPFAEAMYHRGRAPAWEGDITSRALGFSLQPNMAARALVFLFIGWYATWRRRSQVRAACSVALLVAATALTGSRGGIVAAAAVGSIVAWDSLDFSLSPAMNRAVKLALIAVLLPLVYLGALQAFSALHGTFQVRAFERLAHFLQGDTLLDVFGGDLSMDMATYDRSLQYRIDAQIAYGEKILRRPLLGYGLGSAFYFKNSGDFNMSSHNAFLETALRCGVFYPLFLLWIMARLVLHRNRCGVEEVLGTGFFRQTLAAAVLLGLVQNTLFDQPLPFVMLAAQTCLLRFPRRLLADRPVHSPAPSRPAAREAPVA